MSEYQKVELIQTRGPVLRFKGKLLGETEWDARDGTLMILQVYQTEGGALIAVREGQREGSDKRDDLKAHVVEPIDSLDELAATQIMRFEVLDFFEWTDRARTFAKRVLKWSLVQEIA